VDCGVGAASGHNRRVSTQTPPTIEEPDGSTLPISVSDITVQTVKRAPRLARFAVTLALLGCLVGMGWALSMHQETKGPDDIAIERLTPTPGAETVPGQTPIVIDMAFGYDIALNIDGKPVPVEQLIEVESLGQFTFSPGPNKFTERFTNGQHVAQLIYWPKIGTREKDGQIYQWTFAVV
jgi:hypothetical protein